MSRTIRQSRDIYVFNFSRRHQMSNMSVQELYLHIQVIRC